MKISKMLVVIFLNSFSFNYTSNLQQAYKLFYVLLITYDESMILMVYKRLRLRWQFQRFFFFISVWFPLPMEIRGCFKMNNTHNFYVTIKLQFINEFTWFQFLGKLIQFIHRLYKQNFIILLFYFIIINHILYGIQIYM